MLAGFHWTWMAGVLIGASWIFANSFFLFHLVKSGFEPQAKKNIAWLAVLKFPVLYLAGFFILKSRFFPTVSLVVGLTVFLLAFFAVWAKAATHVKSIGKTA